MSCLVFSFHLPVEEEPEPEPEEKMDSIICVSLSVHPSLEFTTMSKMSADLAAAADLGSKLEIESKRNKLG